MNAVQANIPAFADVTREDDVRFFSYADNIAMTLVERDMRSGCSEIYGRLFVNEKLVCISRVLGKGNTDLPGGNVLCFVETHPSHRGNRYSALLIKLMKAEGIGQIYSTGNYSRAGLQNAKHMGLDLVPGNTVRVSEDVEFSFHNWETNELF